MNREKHDAGAPGNPDEYHSPVALLTGHLDPNHCDECARLDATRLAFFAAYCAAALKAHHDDEPTARLREPSGAPAERVSVRRP